MIHPFCLIFAYSPLECGVILSMRGNFMALLAEEILYIYYFIILCLQESFVGPANTQ
jgi:hypothetical protein